MRHLLNLIPPVGFFLLAALPSLADVKMPALFSNDMVLQRDVSISVWGTADPGEKVTVTLGPRQAATTTSHDGKWAVRLEKLAAVESMEMIVSGKNTITIRNVAIGEVWLCSGQSNMEMVVLGANNAAKEIAAANYPEVRRFSVMGHVAREPQAACGGDWVAASPKVVGYFSAAGYFMARDLNKALRVPVGIILGAAGGTPIEAWMPAASFGADPELRPLLKAGDSARLNGGLPTGLYNGMIAPLMPYAIRGVVWYQGESNVDTAARYRAELPAMIQSWRKAWGEGDFPFLVVQLPNYGPPKPQPGDSSWAVLREAQALAARKLPNVGLAVTIDIGEAANIHPGNKQEVGRRLALLAERMVYGRAVAARGPVYKSITLDGNKIRINFQMPVGGLQAKGGEALKGFAIAGDDKVCVWANAKIEGDDVLVQSEKVPQPVSVRYDWADNPNGNLCNKAGFPAAPFRGDSWPRITDQSPIK